MKRNIIGIAPLIVFATLGACSLKQDPLADKSDLIRQATPKPPVTQKPDPIDSQNMVIDAPDQKSFLEGTEGTFELKSRVLIPGYDVTQITIENIDAFQGATFDMAGGQFKWSPALGFTGAEPFRQVKMILKAVASSSVDPAKIPLTRSASVTVMVQKNPQDPAIDRVNGLNATLREDTTAYFYVRVKDPDSDGQVGKAPNLLFLAPDSSILNLAPFVSSYSASYDSTDKVWLYSLHMTLDHELTDSSERGGFKIVAISSYGKRSPEYSFSAKVYTKLKDPETTLKDGQVLQPGVENRIQFLVYDPKHEGDLSLEDKTIPMGAILNCNKNFTSGVLECEFIYTPTGQAGQETEGSLRFRIRSKNTDSSDTQTASGYFDVSYKVAALPKEGGR